MRLLRARCSQALQLSRVNNSLEQIDSINSAGYRAVYFVKKKDTCCYPQPARDDYYPSYARPFAAKVVEALWLSH